MSKEIRLTRGKVAIVDDDNYELLSKWKWFYKVGTFGYPGYAARCHLRKTIVMHRQIMQTPGGLVCDHINGNTLDNQRSNLRNCTNQENWSNNHSRRSSSGFKGVTWMKRIRKYQGQLVINKHMHYLGVFDRAEDAARAYDVAARKLRGEFANTNFSEQEAQNDHK